MQRDEQAKASVEQDFPPEAVVDLLRLGMKYVVAVYGDRSPEWYGARHLYDTVTQPATAWAALSDAPAPTVEYEQVGWSDGSRLIAHAPGVRLQPPWVSVYVKRDRTSTEPRPYEWALTEEGERYWPDPAPTEPPCEHCGSSPCCDPMPDPQATPTGKRLHRPEYLTDEVLASRAPQAVPCPMCGDTGRWVTMGVIGGKPWTVPCPRGCVPQAVPDRCPTCGSDDKTVRGSYRTASKFHRCPDAWHTSLSGKPERNPDRDRTDSASSTHWEDCDE